MTLDRAMEQAGLGAFVVLFQVRHVNVFARRDLLQQVVIEQGKFKTLREHFGDEVTAASEFAADRDD